MLNNRAPSFADYDILGGCLRLSFRRLDRLQFPNTWRRKRGKRKEKKSFHQASIYVQLYEGGPPFGIPKGTWAILEGTEPALSSWFPERDVHR
jgi:hypothetical protein